MSLASTGRFGYAWKSFDDATIEVKALANSKKTAATGDFLFGPIFRRSGDNYYAFTISPRTKKWFVLKNSPTKLQVLQEGTDEGIQGLKAADTLRVDAQGSTFFFHINDRLVDQVSDPDYTSGELGFYVETIDNPRVHIHFDSITIRDVQAPLICTVTATTLYLRSDPSTTLAPITFLVQGERLDPIGRSPDDEWIRVLVESSNQQGWVHNMEEHVSCNVAPADLPVIGP